MTKQPAKLKFLQTSLSEWFVQNHRELPWRQSRDPYRIWISEVMLQQTTTQAVIPYYERFLQRFPRLQNLADANEKEVLKYWAGLGYYSRARNLHKAAKILALSGFPPSAQELIQLPGFGPYTSRAVSSLAFGEKVGVLDGNVIRILSRVTGRKFQWWQTKDREQLQNLADAMAQTEDSATINQAMMELGATICTPQSPSCFICPWNTKCEARKQGLVETLPLKKPKAAGEILLWNIQWIEKNKKIAFVQNDYAPFLRKMPILPGRLERLNKRPEKFDLKHSITKYEIYARIQKSVRKPKKGAKQDAFLWLDLANITEEIPYSLIRKIIQAAQA
jgi:A/G-specific adenine glycosylase